MKITSWIENIRLKNKRVALSRSKAGTVMIGLFMLLVSAFMILPILYSVLQAFKPIDEIFAFPPRFFVRNPTTENFRMALQLSNSLFVPFGRYLINSILVSVGGTIAYVFISSLAAYPLAKGNFPGKSLVSQLIVLALLFSAETMVLPRYLVITKLGIMDTFWAILFPVFATTTGVFLIRQYISAAIPDSTLEAAHIDGAGEYRIFISIVMPTIRASWLTVAIFTFQGFWNYGSGVSYFGYYNYIFSEELKQLPSILLSISQTGGMARSGAGAAAFTLMMIPPLILFIISQSSITDTMAHSGLK